VSPKRGNAFVRVPSGNGEVPLDCARVRVLVVFKAKSTIR
jgi:hypothetical protein